MVNTSIALLRWYAVTKKERPNDRRDTRTYGYERLIDNIGPKGHAQQYDSDDCKKLKAIHNLLAPVVVSAHIVATRRRLIINVASSGPSLHDRKPSDWGQSVKRLLTGPLNYWQVERPCFEPKFSGRAA